MNARAGSDFTRAHLRTAISSWTPGIKPTWTIQEVRHALRMHREGVFSHSAQLIDTFGEDDQIPQLLEKRADALFQNDFDLKPVEAPNRQLSKRIADQFGPLWWDSFPESELDEFFRWYKMAGVGLAVLDDWKRGAKSWTPTLKTLPIHFLRRDEHAKKWFYQAREGEFEVTPGDGRWVLLTDGPRGWLRGLVRQVAIGWVAKQLTIRDWNRYNERHGLPIIKAMAPAIADADDKDQFWGDMEDLASESVAQLPTDLDESGAKFDLELLEAKDQSWKSFEANIDRIDRKFTVIFLGGHLNTEVASTGSNRATSNDHADELSKKATADEKRLTTTIRHQGLWPVVSLNYAGAKFEATPWPHWDTALPEDAEQKAKGQKAFGEAVTAVQDAGFDVTNVEELAEKHDLEVKRKEPTKPTVPTNEPHSDPAALAEFKRNTGAFLLASGASVSENRGFVEGQLYVDAAASNAAAAAGKTLKPDLDAILQDIDASNSYGELRDRLTARYSSMSAEEISDLVYQAMVVARLAGHRAVIQDS